VDRKPCSLWSACLENAERLLEEAELLLEHGHFARAYALGFTAYEEVGKSQFAADWATGLVTDDVLDAAFKQHRTKVAYAARHYDSEANIVYAPEDFQAHWLLRQSALYVERDANNAPIAPRTVVCEEDALDMIETVRRALDEIDHALWLNERIGTKGLFK